MTTPTPAGNMHIASVDYAVSFAVISSAGGRASFSAAGTHYIFTFDTGQTLNPDGSWSVSHDMSWFVQAQVEAGIIAGLNTDCGGIATMLGVPLAQVQGAVTVRRIWAYTENSYTVIPGVTSGPQQSSWIDVMAYP